MKKKYMMINADGCLVPMFNDEDEKAVDELSANISKVIQEMAKDFMENRENGDGI